MLETVWPFLMKLNIQLFSNLISGYLSKNNGNLRSQSNLYVNVYSGFTYKWEKKKKTHNNWKQPTCPSGGKWMNQLCTSLLSSKKKELLVEMKTWMNLKSIILTDGSLDSKSYIFYDSKGMTSWKSQNYRDRQLICWQEMGLGTRDWLQRDMKECFWVMEYSAIWLWWWFHDCTCL